MGFSLIANVGAATSDGNNVTTGSIDTSGADLIVIAVEAITPGSYTLSDSKSNTWTGLTSYGTTYRMRLFYCYAPTVGSGHTFTVSSSGEEPALAVAAFSGAAASPFESQSGASGGTGFSLATGSITPAMTDELLVTGIHWQHSSGGTPPTINGGFTITDTPLRPFSLGAGLAYLIQTTPAAANPTWTSTDAVMRSAAIACFKATTSVAIGGPKGPLSNPFSGPFGGPIG